MIQSHSEDKIRKLLIRLDKPLQFSRSEASSGEGPWWEKLYAASIECLVLVEELKKELGFKEPETLPNDKLKQTEIKF